jgi:poly(3-hydroxybutyrate) depolymerase
MSILQHLHRWNGETRRTELRQNVVQIGTLMNRRLLIRCFTAVLPALLFGSIDRPAAARPIRWEGMVDGVRRMALIEPGKDATTTPLPLVFVFHGFGAGADDLTPVGFARAWPEATFAYPQGGLRQNWTGSVGAVWQDYPGQLADRDRRRPS